eukprot:6408440-Pyramimonas_sp.AAC.1
MVCPLLMMRTNKTIMPTIAMTMAMWRMTMLLILIDDVDDDDAEDASVYNDGDDGVDAAF